MRVALVDNGTKEPDVLGALFFSWEVVWIPLEQADEALQLEVDLIVLSGSSRFPIMENLELLEPEMRLIRKSLVPVLGICFGCELINVAFGGTLRETPEKRQGIFEIGYGPTESELIGPQEVMCVFEAHRWVLDSVPPALHVLAKSSSGPEIIRHTSRPIFGFQFHPEKYTQDTQGKELFNRFLLSAGLLPSSTAVGS